MEGYLRLGIERFLALFYPVFKKLLPYQVYAYLAVGGINTALNILLFILFFQWILPIEGMAIGGYGIASYTIALLMAFLITIPTGFWLSKYFAFNSNKHCQKAKAAGQLGKYFLVVLQGLVSDYALLKLLIEVCHIYPTIAKVLSTMIVLLINYLLQKHFTFKTKMQQ
ncbi:GtrA family protein [Echinicola sp. 20G]|uniref:GtrA family protein n=1 Tax=Echinicola sp. 20G TaxID=2781961 RepID=UPI00190FD424|nr:GtrA family protein [Echinicola sp. 20G]